MEITDEMVEAAWRRYQKSLKTDSSTGELSMRSALEAALGARPKMYADILLALRGVTPDNKLAYDAATCIEDLAGALKDAREVLSCAKSINTCRHIDATLEKWGLK